MLRITHELTRLPTNILESGPTVYDMTVYVNDYAVHVELLCCSLHVNAQCFNSIQTQIEFQMLNALLIMYVYRYM